MLLDVNKLLSAEWLKQSLKKLEEQVSDFYSVDEDEYIKDLYSLAYQDGEQSRIEASTEAIIEQSKKDAKSVFFDLEALLQEYSLSDEDGVLLMCLAEALLRVPDAATRDALISDKLSGSDWQRHFSKDNSLFVNAATWGLMIAGGIVRLDQTSIKRLFKSSTKPVIRSFVDRAMRIMGQHFVLGQSIEEGMKNAKPYLKRGYDYSYDMLGESAITKKEAQRYCDSYRSAIKKIANCFSDVQKRPSLSIKLSALHPRLEETHRDSVVDELSATVLSLVQLGIENNVGVTIDAEEADRLELTMSIFEKVYANDALRKWGKFGLVVQAYSRRALPVLCWLTKLAKSYGDEIPVRLVKGAYWDTEIKHSQVLGLEAYPVFTRKEYTDTAYLACSRFMLSDVTRGAIYPQFASHNAHTVSSVKVMAPSNREYEFQRLHGMGDSLYDSILASENHINVRIYAPIGTHEDLLPYLVRRLLENGANSSFVHKLSDENLNITELVRRPLLPEEIGTSNKVLEPKNIFSDRENSSGVNLITRTKRSVFMKEVAEFAKVNWTAHPIIAGDVFTTTADSVDVLSPFDRSEKVGHYNAADEALANKALDYAVSKKKLWQNTAVEQRCQIIEAFADQLEKNRAELIALCQREAGKTLQDSIDEIREAVDFCRYYAQQAREKLIQPQDLPGPTGESNQLTYEPRGLFVCISPWNFPLAIFTGQIVAGLLAGNVVIAKPAEATTLVAYFAMQLLFRSGLPDCALQFLPGSGSKLGAILNSDVRVNGVVFTGSTATANRINKTLVNRDISAPIATLIAETGGLNAMIVDSTALPEQVATDVVTSAFGSAGQRCSALRILYVQEDIADRVIDLIKGAMSELVVGDPRLLSTDIGPVIDRNSQQKLLAYIASLQASGCHYFQVKLQDKCESGTFVPPTLFEVSSIADLPEEQFGPILHIARFAANDLDKVIAGINNKGYGLTLGVHSRNRGTYEKVAAEVAVGNVYINRNQIGAVVGVNPFGGRGLSGTGPKAGGPNYLLRFVTEKTVTNNVTAIGGNVELLNEMTKG